MRLREFRRSDGPRFFELLKSEFPEEEAMLGMRPEGFEAVIRRLYRADIRLFLAVLRAFHRSPFHLYILEEAGRLAGITLLSFAPRAGFISSVVVPPEFRRRGFARQLIEAARAETGRRGRPYVALQVLAQNAPARALYAAAGYRELDHQTFVVHDAPATLAGADGGPSIRAYRRSDAAAVAELANRLHPEPVREVLPVRPRDLTPGTWADRLFDADSAAWVVDRGRGPEAHVTATASPVTDAAHLGTPVIGESVEPELGAELVRVAGSWLAGHHPTRIATSVADHQARAHTALRAAGFHDGIEHYLLFRPAG